MIILKNSILFLSDLTDLSDLLIVKNSIVFPFVSFDTFVGGTDKCMYLDLSREVKENKT